jgi:HPr kinase/phosphorylase
VSPAPKPPPGSSEQIHGALVEVRGTGVLILGESGLGKSETALELVTRGHRLVADDVVRVEPGPDGALVGQAPELIRHHLEVRGIGIVDVRRLYGEAAVCTSFPVDLVCRIVPWERDRVFERVGLERPEEVVAGRKLPAVVLPARPSGNLATLVDLAVRDHRDRARGGGSAARRLDERVQAAARERGGTEGETA